jgi:Outer membrane protein beta-barrel family
LQFQNGYSYSAGNPFLLPQYAQNIGLRYTYKKFLSTYIFYSHVNQLMTNAIANQDPIFITRPENFGSNCSINLALSWSISLAKWWEFNTNIFVFHLVNKGEIFGKSINESVNTGEFRLSNQFRFGKNWSGELTGFYATEHISGQIHTAPFGYLGGGVQKKILGGKGTIKFKADDIFWMIKINDTSSTITNATFSRITQHDSRQVGFSFNYSFGKTNNNRRNNRNGGADDEQRRAN